MKRLFGKMATPTHSSKSTFHQLLTRSLLEKRRSSTPKVVSTASRQNLLQQKLAKPNLPTRQRKRPPQRQRKPSNNSNYQNTVTRELWRCFAILGKEYHAKN